MAEPRPPLFASCVRALSSLRSRYGMVACEYTTCRWVQEMYGYMKVGNGAGNKIWRKTSW